jgi:hypothetical protein
LYHSAWVEDDEIYGDGVVNDKGPMAAFLVAVKAIRDRLPARRPGRRAVASEISHEPVDGPGPAYLSRPGRGSWPPMASSATSCS